MVRIYIYIYEYLCLLRSPGFGDFTRAVSADRIAKGQVDGWAAGVQWGRPPFMSPAEERQAESRLDLFMSECLIPLAAETNAVVICGAIPARCILSASFTRMLTIAKAKWGGRPPFSVLSCTNDMGSLYCTKKSGTLCWQ